MNKVSARTVVVASMLFTMLTWVVIASRWWFFLDGDSPVHSIMGWKIAHEGDHFIMMAGQSYGGTLLTYVRALVFKFLDFSPFVAFYTTGIFVSVTVALWSLVAYKLAGAPSALITASIAAFGNRTFNISVMADYWIHAFMLGAVSFLFSIYLAEQERLNKRHFAILGFLWGYSIYNCRASAIFLIFSVVLFLLQLPRKKRIEILPTFQELRKSNVIIQTGSVLVLLGTFLAVVSYFTSETLPGLKVALHLGVSFFLALSLFISLRWHNIYKARYALGIFVITFILGFLPEIFYLLAPIEVPHVLRFGHWKDFLQYFKGQYQLGAWRLPPLTTNLGIAFCSTRPLGLGLLGFTAVMFLSGLACTVKTPALRKKAIFSAALTIFTLSTWLGISAELPFMSQHLTLAFFPICLLVGLTVQHARPQFFTKIFALVLFTCGVVDFHSAWKSQNHFEQSGLISQVEGWSKKYGITRGFADFPSTYEMTLALKKRVELVNVCWPDRFRSRLPVVQAEKRVFYLRHDNESVLPWKHPGYRVIDHARKDEYDVWVLEQTDRKLIEQGFGPKSGCFPGKS